MRYKAKIKDCRMIVTAKASWGEEIDEIVMDAFGRIYLKGFLKPKIVKKNMIEYTGPVGISLFERLKKPLSKRDFLLIMQQIVMAVQKIQHNNLPLNKIVLDTHYVFINETTKEINFLYVPSTKEIENPGVLPFVESVMYAVVPAVEKDTGCVSRFIYFLKGQKEFKPEQIEKFILKEDPSVVATIKKQSDFMTGKQKYYYGQDNSADDDGDPNGVTDEDDQPEDMPEDHDDKAFESREEETALLDQDDESGTDLLDEDQYVHYPTLLRVLTEETIRINKTVFRLGKKEGYVDYRVTDNNTVSRTHADIITRGYKYFVIDLESKNHTYINDQMLAVNCETEIHDGDRLKLANEEFIFRE